MRRIVWTPKALRDLDRLENFLFDKNPNAAARAIQAILSATRILAQFPEAGRVRDDLDHRYRELLVPFASGGYLVHYDVIANDIQILDVRHQREAAT